jgi:hypothetical protein
MSSPRPLTVTTAIAVTACSLVLAACGSSSPGSSSAASASSASDRSGQSESIQPAIDFVDCMRSHGVSDIPDPTTSPRGFKESLSPSTPHSPAFLSALKPCQHFLIPKGGANQSPAKSPAQAAAFLAFAGCIRSHGFPSFPDPSSAGEITHEMLASAGINLNQPAVAQAADACVGVTHGYITRTDVARFIAGQ